MGKYKIVVIGQLNKDLMNQLEQKCEIKVWSSPQKIPRDTLLSWLSDAEGFISRGDVVVNGELLSKAPKLRVIAQASVGYDNVDIDACMSRSIPFGNTPEVLNEATADLIYGLLISSARRIHEGFEYVKDGKWESPFNIPMGVDLYEKTLGIIGMGNIGRRVAVRAQASGMNILYHNRKESVANNELNCKYETFENVLKQSDFIIVLVPLSNQTKKLFKKTEFEIMKQTAYFINASRGAVVDTNALYQALVNKEIAYAALDVTDPEPIQSDHPILKLNNILITPHIGSATTETRYKMGQLTVENLLAGLESKKMPSCVNKTVYN
ncbi:2-hydroxyacid dehydrogenase [Oceanobacillus jeddahense]|uniref:D-glycerate dehydrogenase n=1 Tax=Oceanobacillus jeddahense TaxID=1462527 RepID=A0ABY5JU70_9BACI|nr:D-glycerate dehydrogenase [Oceanobacillus jeddahense]UUI03027.1 D-glycerate dehydrogenase [Oceanobacillus jeddahense]